MDDSDSKVMFRVEAEDGMVDVETLWATPLGEDRYRLDNSPFYAYSVSWQDVVHAPFDAAQGCAVFSHVASKSGNRTVRVVLEEAIEAGNASDMLLGDLVALGCSYEGMGKRYMSVTVPPEVDLQAIRSFLVAAQVQWEHADPTHAELFPSQA